MEALRATYGSDSDDGGSSPPIPCRHGDSREDSKKPQASDPLPPPPLDLLRPPNFVGITYFDHPSQIFKKLYPLTYMYWHNLRTYPINITLLFVVAGFFFFFIFVNWSCYSNSGSTTCSNNDHRVCCSDFSSMTQGSRVRNFPHVEGNYALHVFIPGHLFL